MTSARRNVSLMIAVAALCFLESRTVRAQGDSSLDQILSFIAEIKQQLVAIEAKLSTPKTAAATPEAVVSISSGLFNIPANAQAVDWTVVNDSTAPVTFNVTVFRGGTPKTVVSPGTLTVTVAAGATFHNANSVGPGQPFTIGFYYEVVIQTPTRNLLPSVSVWQDHGNTGIPGTLIPPGMWVQLQ